MEETNVSEKKYHLLHRKPFCRLCLSSMNDEQRFLFSSPSVDALFDRIQQCTGVQLMNFPDMCHSVCDGCVSHLVICEKFVKQCREVDQKLRHLLDDCNDTQAARGQTESLIPGKQPNNDEDIPLAEVQQSKSNLEEKGHVTPYDGKSTGDEICVVEIVDANHENSYGGTR
ncbi:uncharacterized protein LOC125769532 [Anopheles funestus]|uniref:uncharacterized protein LOC125769532 n=1 Tax=Anopheles funestus TaxID=62324 RepID=UPI0020C5D0F6|nr:uncharacterized protein LOC125769532 [Anopheles funestus]